jgi:hypothetical protein
LEFRPEFGFQRLVDLLNLLIFGWSSEGWFLKVLTVFFYDCVADEKHFTGIGVTPDCVYALFVVVLSDCIN